MLPIDRCTGFVSNVMGWEKGGCGVYYYTRSRKEHGRVVREYVGGGMIGTLAARMDAEERERRKEEAQVHKAQRREMEALAEPVEELSQAAEILARAALLAAGYHRHERGEWRRRRDKI